MQAVEVNVRVQAPTVRAQVSQGVGEVQSLGQLGRLASPLAASGRAVADLRGDDVAAPYLNHRPAMG